MTSASGRPDPASPTLAASSQAVQLRRIALHQETSVLLDQRAARARSAQQAALLAQRAAEHRRLAAQLRRDLAATARARRRDTTDHAHPLPR